MGYQTGYNLSLSNAGGKDFEIIKDLRNSYEETDIAFDRDGVSNEDVKWKDHEENLIEFSRKYPDVIFTLDFEDEEGDLWKKYFRNGKKQIANAILIIRHYWK